MNRGLQRGVALVDFLRYMTVAGDGLKIVAVTTDFMGRGDAIPRLTLGNDGSIHSSQDGVTAQTARARFSFVTASGLAAGVPGFLIKDGGNASIIALAEIDDAFDAPIWWAANAGGIYQTDNFTLSHGVYDYVWKLGTGQATFPESLEGFGTKIVLHGLPNPPAFSPTVVAGGSLAASTTYYWRIVPFNYQSTTPGGTLTATEGNGIEVTATTTSPNKTVNFSFPRGTNNVNTNGVSGWHIYRSTTSGVYGATSFLMTVVNSGFTNITFTDDGSVALSAGSPAAAPQGSTSIRMVRWPTAAATDYFIQWENEFGAAVAQLMSTGDVKGSRICPGPSSGGVQGSGFYHDTAVPSNANGANNDWDISDNGILYFKNGSGIWVPRSNNVYGHDHAETLLTAGGNWATNGTTLASILGSTISLPANSLAVGDTFTISASGFYNNNASASTLEVKLLFGGVAAFDWTTASLSTSANNRRWTLNITVTVKAIGSGTSANTDLAATAFISAASAAQPVAISLGGGASGDAAITGAALVSGFDSTAATTIDLQMKLGTASAGASMGLRQFSVVKNPA